MLVARLRPVIDHSVTSQEGEEAHRIMTDSHDDCGYISMKVEQCHVPPRYHDNWQCAQVIATGEAQKSSLAGQKSSLTWLYLRPKVHAVVNPT